MMSVVGFVGQDGNIGHLSGRKEEVNPSRISKELPDK